MKRVVIWLLAVCMLICMTPANVMAADKSEEDIVVTILSESVYNGHEQEPEMTVVLNGKKLKETTDYTVKYFDNINAGMATVTVDLDEKYSEYADAVIKQFPIKPCPISTCIIDIEDEDCVYNGKAVKPEVTVEESHGLEELTLGKDYTISYNNNVNPGKASVTITGKGNYCGTVNKPFTVKKIPVDDVVFEDVSDKTYSGKLIKPTP